MEINANSKVGAVSGPSQTNRSGPINPAPVDSDGDSFDSNNPLLNALNNTPDVRADVVARGRAAVASDGYPPPDVVKKLSNFLANKLQSNDL